MWNLELADHHVFLYKRSGSGVFLSPHSLQNPHTLGNPCSYPHLYNRYFTRDPHPGNCSWSALCLQGLSIKMPNTVNFPLQVSRLWLRGTRLASYYSFSMSLSTHPTNCLFHIIKYSLCSKNSWRPFEKTTQAVLTVTHSKKAILLCTQFFFLFLFFNNYNPEIKLREQCFSLTPLDFAILSLCPTSSIPFKRQTVKTDKLILWVVTHNLKRISL